MPSRPRTPIGGWSSGLADAVDGVPPTDPGGIQADRKRLRARRHSITKCLRRGTGDDVGAHSSRSAGGSARDVPELWRDAPSCESHHRVRDGRPGDANLRRVSRLRRRRPPELTIGESGAGCQERAWDGDSWTRSDGIGQRSSRSVDGAVPPPTATRRPVQSVTPTPSSRTGSGSHRFRPEPAGVSTDRSRHL